MIGDITFGRSFLGTDGAAFLDPSASWCAGNMVASIGGLADRAEKRCSGSFHSPATQAELLRGLATPPSPASPWRQELASTRRRLVACGADPIWIIIGSIT